MVSPATALNELKEALREELEPAIDAYREANTEIIKGVSNLDRVKWFNSLRDVFERGKLQEAYHNLPSHPPKGIAKRAAQEIASYERASIVRRITRLQSYARARARRDGIDIALESKLDELDKKAI